MVSQSRSWQGHCRVDHRVNNVAFVWGVGWLIRAKASKSQQKFQRLLRSCFEKRLSLNIHICMNYISHFENLDYRVAIYAGIHEMFVAIRVCDSAVDDWGCVHGPLARYVKLRVRMRRECRERFPRHRRWAIPTCITARASRTCRDACRDRQLSVSFEIGGGGKRSRHSRRMRNLQFYVSGKRPIGPPA